MRPSFELTTRVKCLLSVARSSQVNRCYDGWNVRGWCLRSELILAHLLVDKINIG